MDQYVGLDVSLKETSISVRQNRKRIWRGKCQSHPKAVSEAIRRHAPDAALVVFETGPLATWFHRCLVAEGLPAVCIDARHAKAAHHIRGVMKTFGLVVPKGGGRIFETNVATLLAGQEALASIILPLLETWRTVRAQAARLDRQLMAVARASAPCRLMMTAPGVGALTAPSYASMIEDPANFKNARAVGAYIGLTARSYQSGEIDYDGHISKRGDKHVRALLYEAAVIVLTRVRSASVLRTWGLKLKDRAGFKRAAVAVARKLAVIMHAMWRDGSTFDPTIMAA